MDLINDKNVEKLVGQGLSESEAYELLYLLSLGADTELSGAEKERKKELVGKKKS